VFASESQQVPFRSIWLLHSPDISLALSVLVALYDRVYFASRGVRDEKGSVAPTDGRFFADHLSLFTRCVRNPLHPNPAIGCL